MSTAASQAINILVGAKNDTEKGLGGALGSFKSFFKNVAAISVGTAMGHGIAGMVEGVIDFANEGIHKALEGMIQAEERAHALGTALKLVGADAEQQVPELQNFAKSITQVTTYSRGALLDVMKLGVSLGGFSGEGLKSATIAAIGLSQKLGIDLEAAMRLVAKAGNGNTTMLARYGLVLKDAHTPQEKFNAVLAIGAQNFALAEAHSHTLGGRLSMLSRDFNQLYTIVGIAGGKIMEALFGEDSDILGGVDNFIQRVGVGIGKLPELVKPYIESFREVVGEVFNWYTEHMLPGVAAATGAIVAFFGAAWGIAGEAVRSVVSLIGMGLSALGVTFEGFTGVVDFAKQVVQVGFITMEYAFTHWREILELVLTAGALGLVTFANEVQYFFTEVIPQTVIWFADNWRDIFTDLWNFTKTVFENLGSNIVNIITSLPELIAGTTDFGDVWKPLTDGFQSALKELPQIADRQKGGLEQSLSDQVGALEDSLGDGFMDFLNNRLKETQNAGVHTADAIKSAFAGLGFHLPEFGGANAKGAGATDAAKAVVTIEAPKLEESRFLSGFRAANQDPLTDATLDNGKKQDVTNEKLDTLIGAVEEINGGDGGGEPALP